MKFSFWSCTAVIFILATIPLKMPQIDTSFGDKINHIAAFVTLYLLLVNAYVLPKRLCIVSLLFYGFFIECVQYFLPYRDFSLLDLSADGVGIFIGMVTYNLYEKKGHI